VIQIRSGPSREWGGHLREGLEDGREVGAERNGVFAEPQRVTTRERDAAEGVAAVALERGRGIVGRRAEALLGVGEEAVERLRRVPRVQRRVDPLLRVETLRPELRRVHHHHFGRNLNRAGSLCCVLDPRLREFLDCPSRGGYGGEVYFPTGEMLQNFTSSNLAHHLL
jgi:hypothetical protein